jgi:cation:H+ antiporter
MAIAIPLLVFGFVLLIKGADLLIDGASSMAKKFGISSLVIGLTIVSFGTSAPELLVNIVSSLRGSNELILGNIFGSNIANIFLILGVAAMIYNLRVTHSTVWRGIPFVLLAILVGGILANDELIDGRFFSTLTRIDGIIMIFFFIIFIYYTYGIRALNSGPNQERVKTYPMKYSLPMVLGGMIGLAWGGQLVVDQAIKLASIWEISETLIGLTIVAIGTSLPELATSAVAAYKKNADVAIGNVVGSNIFNILWVLGLSSIIRPIEVPAIINVDIIIAVIATLLLFLFMFIGKKHILERWQGFSFIVLYAAYITYSIYRG